jgi:hypothetical protein
MKELILLDMYVKKLGYREKESKKKIRVWLRQTVKQEKKQLWRFDKRDDW